MSQRLHERYQPDMSAEEMRLVVLHNNINEKLTIIQLT